MLFTFQSCLKNAGGRGMKTVFLMTDMQIKDEIFLEDVDNLLNSGEVPNIFTSEERAEVTELVQAAIEVENRKNAATPGGGGSRVTQDMSPLALFTNFVNRCRVNLHVIIAFSPIGNAFRNRLRQFPSLINCCTIDWFTVSSAYTYTKPSVSYSNDLLYFDGILHSHGQKTRWKELLDVH